MGLRHRGEKTHTFKKEHRSPAEGERKEGERVKIGFRKRKEKKPNVGKKKIITAGIKGCVPPLDLN